MVVDHRLLGMVCKLTSFLINNDQVEVTTGTPELHCLSQHTNTDSLAGVV
jgi:hypothetical protein